MENRSWFDIRNAAGETEILIYDEIGMFGVTAKDFADELSAKHSDGDKLVVRINSPGGSVFDGLAVANMIKSKKPSEVQIDGLAASIASLIAVSGDAVTIAANGFMMIHDPNGFTMGDSGDHRKTAETLDKIRDTIAQAYVDQTGKTMEEITASMESETWFDATEALEFGLVDSIHDAAKLAANAGGFALHDFKNFAPIADGVGNAVDLAAAQKKEDAIVSDPKENAAGDAPTAANHEEIRAACPGCDSEFILAQLDAKATKDQAVVAWMNKQNEVIDAAKVATAEATAAVDAATAKLEEAEAKPAPHGGTGVVEGAANGGKGGDVGGTATEQYHALVAEKVKAGMPKHLAAQAVNRENPEIRDGFKDEYNEAARLRAV